MKPMDIQFQTNINLSCVVASLSVDYKQTTNDAFTFKLHSNFVNHLITAFFRNKFTNMLSLLPEDLSKYKFIIEKKNWIEINLPQNSSSNALFNNFWIFGELNSWSAYKDTSYTHFERISNELYDIYMLF